MATISSNNLGLYAFNTTQNTLLPLKTRVPEVGLEPTLTR